MFAVLFLIVMALALCASEWRATRRALSIAIRSGIDGAALTLAKHASSESALRVALCVLFLMSVLFGIIAGPRANYNGWVTASRVCLGLIPFVLMAKALINRRDRLVIVRQVEDFQSDIVNVYLNSLRTTMAFLVVELSTGLITYASEPAEKMFGYPKNGLHWQSVEQLVPAGLRHAHELHRDRYKENPTVRPMGQYGMVLQGQRMDGSLIYVAIQLVPVLGKSRVLAVVAEDLTRMPTPPIGTPTEADSI